jgi:photosystem II stability/assembly factor-like uncharacterized protein
MLAVLALPAAQAHDPSAWGGMFRSRDFGATWFPADAGLFIGGALGLAVDPADPNHLLYSTDTRLLRSRNGGRDWTQEPGTQFAAATFAVMLDPRNGITLASTANRIFVADAAANWSEAQAPAGAAPVRAFVRGGHRLFLAGERGVFASEDGGRHWQRAGESLPEAAAAALVFVPAGGGVLLALVDGAVWASEDEGASWRRRDAGLPGAPAEALGFDRRLHVAAQDRIYASDDAGASWQAVGNALPEPGTSVRGIAESADGRAFVLTTHRGALHSTDGGHTWRLIEGVLPVHIEAGPLVRDPTDASTLYAGFSLNPYGGIWRRAADGTNLLAELDPVSLAGGAAFLVLLVVGSAFGVGWLNRMRA